MLDFAVYVLYRAGSAIAAALPLRLLFALGQLLGFCAWLVSGKYRRLAAQGILWTLGLPIAREGINVDVEPKVLELAK